MSFPPIDRPVVCISQARMGSSRLPGKVLMPVLGKSLLEWHVSRLRRARLIDQLVVATTESRADDEIVKLCRALRISVFRGPEQDVLHRFREAAGQAAAGTIVRVTSDCPLIDPDLIDELILSYGRRRPDVDYMTLAREDYPRGLDAEIFSRSALIEADDEAADPAEREHVTPFIYRRPQRYRCALLTSGEGQGTHRWCVDEPQDYELIRTMIERVVPIAKDFTWRHCLDLISAHPEWRTINASVRQKAL